MVVVVTAAVVSVFLALAEALARGPHPALVVRLVPVVVAAAGVSQRKRCWGGGGGNWWCEQDGVGSGNYISSREGSKQSTYIGCGSSILREQGREKGRSNQVVEIQDHGVRSRHVCNFKEAPWRCVCAADLQPIPLGGTIRVYA